MNDIFLLNSLIEQIWDYFEFGGVGCGKVALLLMVDVLIAPDRFSELQGSAISLLFF